MPNFNKESPSGGISNVRNGNGRTEFVPRLSSKTSFSDEDPNGKHPEHTEESKDNLDRIQGQDLIKILPKYVGSDGIIKNETDLSSYAELMQSENSFSHRLLLLKILVATLKSDSSFSKRLIDCESVLIILSLWFSEVEQDKLLESVVTEKILEILSRLQFTVDLLIKYKFGRVVKKIAQLSEKSGVKSKTITDLAAKLFENWSTMASQPDLPSIPLRKSEESFNKEESCQDLTNLSQKRTKVDLAEAQNVATAKSKRSVHFPEDSAKLCKVIIFERAPEEYAYLSDGSEARDNYLHADAGEASIMFKQYSLDDDDEDNLKPWGPLNHIENLENRRGEGHEGEESIIQQQRERTVLSVKYYSINEVPNSPSEEGVDMIGDDSGFKLIPVKANEKVSVRQINIKNNAASIILPPELLNNFLSSTSPLTNFLNPFVNVQQSQVQTHDSMNLLDTLNHSTLNNANSSAKLESHRHPTQGYSSRSICRHYRPGKQFSCRMGSSCKFLHQD